MQILKRGGDSKLINADRRLSDKDRNVRKIDKNVIGGCFVVARIDKVRIGSFRAILHRIDLNHECGKLIRVSTFQEIQAAIPKLSRVEIEQIREWIDDFLEDRLDLSDDVQRKLDQSRAEIAAGNYKTRRAE